MSSILAPWPYWSAPQKRVAKESECDGIGNSPQIIYYYNPESFSCFEIDPMLILDSPFLPLSSPRSWFMAYSSSWPPGPACYWFWRCPSRIVPHYSLWLTSLYHFGDECLMIFSSLQLTAFLISTLAHGLVSHSIPIFEAAIRASISHKIWMVIFSYFTSYTVRQWVA